MSSAPGKASSGKRRTRIAVASAGVLAVTVALCVSFIGSAAAGGSPTQAKHAPPYTFVVSNNFLGNDWRPQVEKLAQLTAKLPPFAGKVNVKIVNSGSTNQAQIADLNSIIQTKPDAIMLIAGSSTALDPTVQRACAAGILVFTISGPVTAKCAWNVNQNFYQGMTGVGQWMGKVLKNKGSVLVDQGIVGLGTSQDIENGFLAGLKKTGPAIKVAGKFTGQYAPGPEQSGISNLLAGNADVNGVMTQGYCTPVFNAFKQAGKGAVPATCYGYNGELGVCAQTGHACAVLSGSPDVMQIAMKDALDILEGKPAPPKNKIIPVPMTLFITATPKVTVSVPGLNVEVIKKNVNFFPSLPPGLALPYSLPQYKSAITPQAAVGKK
jgi:ribose transport system substrate-binding protein